MVSVITLFSLTCLGGDDNTLTRFPLLALTHSPSKTNSTACSVSLTHDNSTCLPIAHFHPTTTTTTNEHYYLYISMPGILITTSSP